MRHPGSGKGPIRPLVLLLALLYPQLPAQSAAATSEIGTADFAFVSGNYDPASFEPIRMLGFGNVNSAEFSPDGQRIAVSGNSVLFLLDAGTYEVERQLFGHTGLINAVKWSPDGRFLASGGEDYLVKIWDAESGELVRTLEGHFRRVNSLDWSPDGLQLVSAGDFTTVVWEMETGNLIAFLSNAIMTTVAWSPDGQFVAAGDALDSRVRIWEAGTWSLVSELTGRGHLNTLAWSPDSNLLALGGSDPYVRIWQTQTWELIRTLEHTRGGINGLAWSRGGRFLASGGAQLNIWDSDGFLVQTLGDQPGFSGVDSVAWDAEGTRLVCGGSRRVYVWSLEVGDPPITLRGHVGRVSSVSWNPDGRYLATAADDFLQDHSVNIWGAATGRLLRTFRGTSAGMTSVAWSPDGKLLAAADNIIRIWDAETGNEVKAFGYSIYQLAWSPNGRYIAGGVYLTASIWEVETGQRVRDFPGVVSAWSPDGRSVAVASHYSEGRLRVYEFETGELLWIVQHPYIRAVASSPDGRYLASAGENGTSTDVRIWEAETGNLIRSIPVSTDSVQGSVTWSPDSHYVAAGAWNRSNAITIWDIETGALVRTLLGHTDMVSSVQWSPVACQLATGGRDGAPRLWGCQLQ